MVIYTNVRCVNMRCHKHCTLHGRLHYTLRFYEMIYYKLNKYVVCFFKNTYENNKNPELYALRCFTELRFRPLFLISGN